MNSINIDKQRKPKTKLYTVDTTKPKSVAELAIYTNPVYQFSEITSAKPRRGGKPPTYRYFFYTPYPTVGAPKDQLAEAIAAAAAPAAMAPAAAPAAAPAINNNYGNAHNNNGGLNDIIARMANVGVNSKDEFEELAAMLEGAKIGGRRSRKQRSSRRTMTRRRR